jgi:glycosyltransferase involved in cell wall biosynthesis
VGSLQVERGLVEILEMMPDHPSWKLELAGYGGDETIIREKAAGKPNVTWRGRVDYEEALQISKKADVLFALYDPRIPNHRLASPNKVFEAMMLGKPIIVAHGTHMDEIVLKHDCGLVVDFQDSTGIEAAFQNLEENPRQMLTLGANGRKAYLANYRWEEMEKRLFALYDQLG